jgi:hypothetical protein
MAPESLIGGSGAGKGARVSQFSEKVVFGQRVGPVIWLLLTG